MANTPLIDVRAPVEFRQGSLPNAMNLPILNDEERALIGTTYKEKGQDAAVKLGYELISGEVKESRVQLWLRAIQANPQAVIYCYRGGKRSQITQQWLQDVGIERPIIEGGYKAVRGFLISELDSYSQSHSFRVLTGATGSGKTRLLEELKGSVGLVNLEKIARHRGSAFGSTGDAQPTQIDFENQLSLELLKLEATQARDFQPLVEDESRLIGSCYVPESFFETLRSSGVIWIDESLEARVDNIFADYIANSAIGLAVSSSPRCAEEDQILKNQALQLFARYKNAVRAISRKLGGLRAQEVLADLDFCEIQFLNSQELSVNKLWIEKLMSWYYDPLYQGSLEKRQARILFKGPYGDCLQFCKSK